MIRSIPLTRATAQVATLALGVCAIAPVTRANAFTASRGSGGENAPLNLSSAPTGAHASSGGAGVVRTIVGLLIVIAVIWGLTWILRQVKSSRDTQAAGVGLTSMATLPLEAGRSLHLVRAGSDYVLVGSADHAVFPIHRYSEQQAREAGLTSLPDPSGPPAERAGLPGGSAADSPLDRLRRWTVRR